MWLGSQTVPQLPSPSVASLKDVHYILRVLDQCLTLIQVNEYKQYDKICFKDIPQFLVVALVVSGGFDLHGYCDKVLETTFEKKSLCLSGTDAEQSVKNTCTLKAENPETG
ncbi:hypothetical protein GRJ2_002016700 [Grus japonensis]|uniref:Uncharacterized protein n=1 Tax=Grus japonensis TaxID=30415 RepID=A0ABC9XD80_GRUJA